jgi:DNA-binding protein
MSEQPQEGLVIVGQKPPMNYVVACLSVFNSGVTYVRIKARGQAICRAIETITLLRKAFVKNLVIKNISIDTQEFPRLDRRNMRVSTIDIVLSKPK